MPNASLRNASPPSDRWQQAKSVALRRWDLLQPDDIDRVRGNTERMIELLQVKYGLDRDKATRELIAWSRSLQGTTPAASARR